MGEEQEVAYEVADRRRRKMNYIKFYSFGNCRKLGPSKLQLSICPVIPIEPQENIGPVDPKTGVVMRAPPRPRSCVYDVDPLDIVSS